MTSSLGAGLLWFVLILVAIPVVLWLLKRTPYGAAMSGAGAGVAATRTVSSVSLGQHQRVVTIEVGQGDEKRWLVLGVTPQSITTLHTLSAQPEPVVAAVPPMPFAALLNKVIHARR